MLLITPEEVIMHAFTSREKISPNSIRSIKIDIAQEHFIRPRFGDIFFEKMCDGSYVDFVEFYIKPALAQYVRYGVIDEMSVQMSDNGAIIYGRDNEVSDASQSSDGSKNHTQKLIEQDDRTSSQTSTDTKTLTSSQTDVTDEENFIDMSVANYPQESSTVQATSRGEQTQKVTANSTTDSGFQLSRNDEQLTATKNNDVSSGNRTTESLRIATLVERRVIACRALSDANVLLAKAVRYVERNMEQFESYLPVKMSSRVFF